MRRSQTNNDESKEEQKKRENEHTLTHTQKNETYQCQYMYKRGRSRTVEKARTNRYLYCTQGRVEVIFHLRRFTEKALK